MGFPVGYTEVLVPNIFLHILSLLATLRNLVLSLFLLLGLSDLLDTHPDPDPTHHHQQQQQQQQQPRTPSSLLIRHFLPTRKFLHLLTAAGDSFPATESSCAVCLTEFCGEDEIRCMANCRHIFHRVCVDRWIDHDRRTCPLCRTPFVPYDRVEEYNQRLWDASGVSEFYAHDYTASSSL